MYEEVFSAQRGPGMHIKLFDEPMHSEMVTVRNIPPLLNVRASPLPFVGKAHIAYIADGKVIGSQSLQG